VSTATRHGTPPIGPLATPPGPPVDGTIWKELFERAGERFDETEQMST
jgi:hypothetical protein